MEVATVATVRTRKRGNTYSYAFETGKNAAGKRTTKEKGGFPTREAAYDAGIQEYNEWKHGLACKDIKKIKVSDFLQQWLGYMKTQVKPQTLINYRNYVKNFQGILADKFLNDVTPAMCDTWLHDVAKTIRKTTLVQVRSVYKAAFKYAVYPCQLIRVNPLDNIPLPKTSAGHSVKRVIISREKLQELIERYPQYAIIMQIAYHTGMRISEILGLTWDNVDLQERIIKVRTQLLYASGSNKGRRLTHTLKTHSSYRNIPIDIELTHVLEEWKSSQELDELLREDTYIKYVVADDGNINGRSKKFYPSGTAFLAPVCTSERGYLYQKNTIVHLLGKEGINSHSFRHTHATMLMEAGASEKGIASRLGHVKPTITQEFYIHNTSYIQTQTRDIFERSYCADK